MAPEVLRRRKMRFVRITRLVGREECLWLPWPLHPGSSYPRYSGPLYGCTLSGEAIYLDGEEGFFEVPSDAIEPLESGGCNLEALERRERVMILGWRLKGLNTELVNRYLP